MGITRSSTRRAAASGAVILAVAVLTGCAGTASPGSAVEPAGDIEARIEAALQEESTITVWSWASSPEPAARAFEEKYPNITVEVVNAGSGQDQYTKLQNAIRAGDGAPDIAQVEYQVLPQFVLSEYLVDLREFGFASLEERFTQSTWSAVNVADGLYALPRNSGPMALFYNEEVFDRFGIEVPTTWEEYAEAAATINAADPSVYITNDTGDPVLTTSLIWQAGGKPFRADGEALTIDLQDEGSMRFAELWSGMLEAGQIAPIPMWTDEWYQGLGNGTIATLPAGAWMAGQLQSGVEAGAGKWRVAPMPTHEDGAPASAEQGGDGSVILEQSDNQLVAAAFLRFMHAEEEGIEYIVESGTFPAAVDVLESEEFLEATPEYFGGQKINEVLVGAAESVVPGWSFLPFQAYANSIFSDTVGQSFAARADLADGLRDWQDAIAAYGTDQGFDVTAK